MCESWEKMKEQEVSKGLVRGLSDEALGHWDCLSETSGRKCPGMFSPRKTGVKTSCQQVRQCRKFKITWITRSASVLTLGTIRGGMVEEFTWKVSYGPVCLG